MTLGLTDYVEKVVDDPVNPRRTERPTVSQLLALALPTYTKAEMLALGTPPSSRTVNVSDDVRGMWRYTGTRWLKVEAFVNPLDFGVLNDGTAQATTNMQAAIDAAYNTTTGYNEVRCIGNFKFNSGTLTVKEGVQLTGNWKGDPSHSGTLDVGFYQPDPANGRGTTFQIDTGSGTSTGAFITQHANSVVRGISFYWPSQSQTAATPTSYPWAIAFRGETYTGFNQRVEDCEFINAYQGIDAKYGGRWTIRNNTGQFLKCGIDVEYMFDKSEIANHKHSLLWSSPFVSSPNDNPFKWMNANGVGIRVGRADALSIINPFIFGPNKGIEFHSTAATTLAGNAIPGGVPWCEVIGGGVGDDGVYGLYFSGNAVAVSASDWQATVKIIGTDISASRNSAGGSRYGVYFHSDYSGVVSFVGCHFGRSTSSSSTYNIYNIGEANISVNGSFFWNWGTASIFSDLASITARPAQINLSNNNFIRDDAGTPALTLDIQDNTLGVSTGDFYASLEADAINNTSSLSFFLNGVRMGGGELRTGLADVGAAQVQWPTTKNLILGPATEVATSATDKLLYLPTMNGLGSGSPATASGFYPFVIDRSNLRFQFHNGTTWWGASAALFGSAALDFGSIAAGASAELTITVTGVVTGMRCHATPSGAPEAGLMWGAYVSASNTVTVRLANVTTGAIDPASRTWLVEAMK